MIKEFSEEFEWQFICFAAKTKKIYNLSSYNRKASYKNWYKKKRNYKIMSYRLEFIDSGRFMCKAHYQILLIILLKEFIKLNINADMVIKNVKALDTNIASTSLNTMKMI